MVMLDPRDDLAIISDFLRLSMESGLQSRPSIIRGRPQGRSEFRRACPEFPLRYTTENQLRELRRDLWQ